MITARGLWAYIDGRDAGTAVEKAIHQQDRGFHGYLIVADDSVMLIPTEEIISERYPTTPRHGDIFEFGTLLSSRHAQAELGWTPSHSWRDHV